MLEEDTESMSARIASVAAAIETAQQDLENAQERLRDLMTFLLTEPPAVK